MRYLLFEKGDVVGPFSVDELKGRDGFGESSLVCPETQGTDYSHWKAASKYPEFGYAASAEDEDAPLITPVSSEMPDHKEDKTLKENLEEALSDITPGPAGEQAKDGSLAVSPSPSPKMKEPPADISVEEYFEEFYAGENTNLSEVLGIPQDLEDSDLYLGRFLQDTLAGEGKKRQTEIKKIQDDLEKKQAKGKVITGAPLAEKKEKKKGRVAYPRPMPPAPEDIPAQQDMHVLEAEIIKKAEEIKKDTPVAAQTAQEPEKTAAAAPAETPAALPKQEEKKAVKEEKKAPPKIVLPVKQDNEIVPLKEEKKAEPAKEEKAELPSSKVIQPDKKDSAPAPVKLDVSITIDEVKSLEDLLKVPTLVPKKTEPAISYTSPVRRRMEEDDSLASSTTLDFTVSRRKVVAHTETETKEDGSRILYTIFVILALVAVLAVAGVYMPKMIKSKSNPQSSAGSQEPDAARRSVPAPAIPAAEAAVRRDTTAQAAPAASGAAAAKIEEASNNNKAVAIAKKHNLPKQRATVEDYFNTYFTTYFSQGYSSSWSAEPLYGDIYIVKYKLVKTRKEPILYIFEVDIKKNAVTGALNNASLDLLGL
ncbi:hypothetical protein Dip518_001085 [Parelusimicrobium proximum]|uniref:hypothetical protein n=1 Tax=Parelusimicrobium proximum TaxID=3228953 RepID=UPI003D167FBA